MIKAFIRNILFAGSFLLFYLSLHGSFSPIPVNEHFQVHDTSRFRILPEPVEIIEGSGVFMLRPNTGVFLESGSDTLKDLAQLISTQFSLRQVQGADAAKIILRLNKNLFSVARAEAYTIDIDTDRVLIQATDAAGMFYAISSITQLVRDGKLPSGTVRDYPRFGYRGMHLDVSRHFFPVAFVKRYIDLLARYKFNTFHWHLTDSHGWRLEIKQYPKLTSVGAWRPSRPGIPMTLAEPARPGEKPDYGGFYTQQEARDVIAYARSRYITVIPEIEIPGHCTAALVAYPEYSTQNGSVPLRMPTGYAGDLLHNFCVGNDSTFLFLNNILTEVIDLFPSEYIHIGGDEVKSEPWLRCPRCSSVMKEKKMTSTRQLQAYFTARIDSFVNAKGRKTLGWDEILEAGNLSRNATVLSWRGIQGGIDGARTGHKVVMAPYRYAYFDFYQSDPSLEPDISYAGLFLDSVYAFDPIPPVLTAEQSSFVIGAQACLWTENVQTTNRAEYMVLPRMIAFSEAVWSPPGRKNYSRFIGKLEDEFNFLQQRGYNYARSMYNVSFNPRFDSATKSIELILNDQVAGRHPIFYTDDGSSPGKKAKLYNKPIRLTSSCVINTGTINGRGEILGKINQQRFSIHRAIGRPLAVKTSVPNSGNSRLADGIFGTMEPYDGRWTVYPDSVLQIDLDLQQISSLDSLRFRVMADRVGNAYLPGDIQLLTSTDGEKYEPGYHARQELATSDRRHVQSYSIPISSKARFLRLFLYRRTNVPEPILPAGGARPALFFLDEIEVF